jgi:hypothetical protein
MNRKQLNGEKGGTVKEDKNVQMKPLPQKARFHTQSKDTQDEDAKYKQQTPIR